MSLPITLTNIATTETAMGLTFPGVFKARTSRTNGGSVRLNDEAWFLIPFWDPTDKRTIRRTSQDIKYETTEMLNSNVGFPEDGVAIAKNSAGDWLVLRNWVFTLHGGELHLVLDDVADLWRDTEDPVTMSELSLIARPDQRR
jgi:hypothetical protein